jgi:hypothetical protein
MTFHDHHEFEFWLEIYPKNEVIYLENQLNDRNNQKNITYLFVTVFNESSSSTISTCPVTLTS